MLARSPPPPPPNSLPSASQASPPRTRLGLALVAGKEDPRGEQESPGGLWTPAGPSAGFAGRVEGHDQGRSPGQGDSDLSCYCRRRERRGPEKGRDLAKVTKRPRGLSGLGWGWPGRVLAALASLVPLVACEGLQRGLSSGLGRVGTRFTAAQPLRWGTDVPAAPAPGPQDPAPRLAGY